MEPDNLTHKMTTSECQITSSPQKNLHIIKPILLRINTEHHRKREPQIYRFARSKDSSQTTHSVLFHKNRFNYSLSQNFRRLKGFHFPNINLKRLRSLQKSSLYAPNKYRNSGDPDFFYILQA